jgi:hypothetical protein
MASHENQDFDEIAQRLKAEGVFGDSQDDLSSSQMLLVIEYLFNANQSTVRALRIKDQLITALNKEREALLKRGHELNQENRELKALLANAIKDR